MPLKIYCDMKHRYDVTFSLNPNPKEKIVNGELPKTQIKWFSID